MSELLYTPEGATPINDISDLKPKTLLSRRQLDAAEAVNIAKALRKHSLTSSRKSSWKTPSFLKRLHPDMFCDVWRWAGRYRKTITNVGVRPYLIPKEVLKLCDDLAAWDMPPLEQAVRVHHRLVWIHPFENGNGRHARLASDLLLASHRHTIPRWPTDLSTAGTNRKRYLSALKVADKGDLEPLMEYMGTLCQP